MKMWTPTVSAALKDHVSVGFSTVGPFHGKLNRFLEIKEFEAVCQHCWQCQSILSPYSVGDINISARQYGT